MALCARNEAKLADVAAEINGAAGRAAEAAGDDTTWQPLVATLSESNRVPLNYLLPALAAQCSVDSG